MAAVPSLTASLFRGHVGVSWWGGGAGETLYVFVLQPPGCQLHSVKLKMYVKVSANINARVLWNGEVVLECSGGMFGAECTREIPVYSLSLANRLELQAEKAVWNPIGATPYFSVDLVAEYTGRPPIVKALPAKLAYIAAGGAALLAFMTFMAFMLGGEEEKIIVVKG